MCDPTIDQCTTNPLYICLEDEYNQECGSQLLFATAKFGRCAPVPCAIDEDCRYIEACDEPLSTDSLTFVCTQDDICRRGGGSTDNGVGAPCEWNDDCSTNYCVAAMLGSEEIPNGYCTTDDEGVCEFAEGGHMVDMSEGGDPRCFAACDDDSACRPEDGIHCFDPNNLVTWGCLTEEQMAQFWGGVKICLPDVVITRYRSVKECAR
ncbi:MAG: hypothetical protein C4523_11770 [Myxococcales bacterium]|nr:MAG: hypothetical protein C4523_11770 [Myxococcales bacterium]